MSEKKRELELVTLLRPGPDTSFGELPFPLSAPAPQRAEDPPAAAVALQQPRPKTEEKLPALFLSKIKAKIKLPKLSLLKEFQAGLRAYQCEQYKKAFPLLKEAAAKDLPAYIFLLILVQNKLILEKTEASSTIVQTYLSKLKSNLFRFQQELDKNNFFIEYCAGLMYRHAVLVPLDFTKAFEFFQSSAKKNYAPAQHELGRCYLKGHGVARSIIQAIRCFNQAEAQNYPPASFELGKMARLGYLHLYNHNKNNAHAHIAKAVEGEHVGALLAQTYSYLKSEQEDAEEAQANLSKAVELGGNNFTAEIARGFVDLIGYMNQDHLLDFPLNFFESDPHPRDQIARALGNFQHLADRGSTTALNLLEYCRACGYGVPKNMNVAYGFFLRAKSKPENIARQKALLTGLHARAGQNSLLSRLTPALFDKQVLRIPLRLGAAVKLKEEKLAASTSTSAFSAIGDWYPAEEEALNPFTHDMLLALGNHYLTAANLLKDSNPLQKKQKERFITRAIIAFEAAVVQGYHRHYTREDLQHYMNIIYQAEALQVLKVWAGVAHRHPEAQYRLARCHESGIVTKKKCDPSDLDGRREPSQEQAIKWYTKAAMQGHRAAFQALIRLGLSKGHPQALYELGRCYEEGRGVARDLLQASLGYQMILQQTTASSFQPMALEALKKLAKSNPEAQFRLGECYVHGWQVKPELSKAKGCFEKAAGQGHAAAAMALSGYKELQAAPSTSRALTNIWRERNATSSSSQSSGQQSKPDRDGPSDCIPF